MLYILTILLFLYQLARPCTSNLIPSSDPILLPSKMAGTVYLRTNRFEVKLEGITFKTKDFGSLCKMDFLFPDEKIWTRRPIVGLDVMRHPRDSSVLLLLLCFGIGCVILKFREGETLPASIHRFLADKRIHFVSFGIPEKKDLFPFEALGLTKNEVDIGYLAAKVLKDPKYKRWELSDLARKVLGIKRMIGLTDASSFERHEQIKCAICQLFVTSVIAMGLLGANDEKKMDYSSKKSSFLKNLNSLHLLADGWFKLPKAKKKKIEKEASDDLRVHVDNMDNDDQDNLLDDDLFVHTEYKDDPFSAFLEDTEIVDDSETYSSLAKIKEIESGNDFFHAESSSDDMCDFLACGKDKDIDYSSSEDRLKGVETPPLGKKPIKGILKCPSTTLMRSSSSLSKWEDSPPSPSTTPNDQKTLRRANSKGYNVSFKFV